MICRRFAFVTFQDAKFKKMSKPALPPNKIELDAEPPLLIFPAFCQLLLPAP